MISTANELKELAEEIARRNVADERIARIIGRPASQGNIGEFIASRIFGIELFDSAAHKAADGRFEDGQLRGASVNIKLFGQQKGLLNMRADALPDYYLVLTGPKGAPASSRGETRPLVVESAFLLDATRLVQALSERGVKIGIATSVAREYWQGAELYPEGRCSMLTLSDEQRRLLSLFRSR